jgi:hypothetical protein
MTMRYINIFHLPSKPVLAGKHLAHNHIKPVPVLGVNGFRAWVQTDADNVVDCKCDFGGVKNAGKHKLHYRIDRSKWK